MFDRIVSKTFYNEKEARDLVYILLSTIQHLHDHNIVHKDLKPENLLLVNKDDDATIKLADFGFASRIDPSEGKYTLTNPCGTPGMRIGGIWGVGGSVLGYMYMGIVCIDAL
mgnify:CR=1 FL=1